MTESLQIELPSAADTEQFGGLLAACVSPGLILLQGELGAGKTCLARALLRGLGYAGRVKSPTYALVESYPEARIPVRHWDLYRIADPAELDLLGLREFDGTRELMLIEWPERAGERLPAADMTICLLYHGDGRRARITAASAAGRAWLNAIERQSPSVNKE